MDKDFVSNSFFSDNERYADIINGVGCDGVPFVRGGELQELDTRVSFGRWKGFGKRRIKRTMYRDLLRKTPFGVNFAIIGIENQEEIDYALPLRIMCYDAEGYERQADRIRREVRKNRKGISAGEYLYGFMKSSRLFPTVTFVLYYGEKEWDGVKNLHGLLDFTDIPDSLKGKIPNYQIHVIEVMKLTDTSIFKTDVKQVFDFIRFSKDKQKIRELVSTDLSYTFLDEDAYDMVACHAGEEEMFRIKEKHKKGGKVNMCQGLREWMEEERMEGKSEGEDRFAFLTQGLIEDGRTGELLRAVNDKEYRKQLYMEYKI